MTNGLNRRAIIKGAIVTAVASAPFTVTTKGKAVADKLDAMQAVLENVNVLEVTGESYSPHYRKGDLVFVLPSNAKATDHVYLEMKSGTPVFAALVHADDKAFYVRGFKTNSRMQAVALKNIKSWGRVVISFRG